MIVEIAVFCMEAMALALAHGAHRVECCSNYLNGGVSISTAELATVPAEQRHRIMVMARLRDGDYQYSQAEQAALLDYAQEVADLGFAGIVCGAVTRANVPDPMFLRHLRAHCPSVQLTFHRAFDSMPDKHTIAKQLADEGWNRILTSGNTPAAINSLELLTSIQRSVGDGIRILPGGGIRSHHLQAFKDAGFAEVHSAAVDDASKSIPYPLPNVFELQQLLTVAGK